LLEGVVFDEGVDLVAGGARWDGYKVVVFEVDFVDGEGLGVWVVVGVFDEDMVVFEDVEVGFFDVG